MRSVVLDTDGANALAIDPDALIVISQAVADGRLALLATHVVRDEVAAYGNQDRRAKLEAVLALAKDVPTGVFMIGRSRLGHAMLGSDDDVLKRLREGRRDHIHANDALISTAARMQGRALLSLDNRAVRAARSVGIEVIAPLELLIEMGYDPAKEIHRQEGHSQVGDQLSDDGRAR